MKKQNTKKTTKIKSTETLHKIIWLDACALEVDKSTLNTIHKLKDGREMLVTNITYGKIVKKMQHVIVIMTEDSTGKEKDMTFIPRDSILEIKEFTNSK